VLVPPGYASILAAPPSARPQFRLRRPQFWLRRPQLVLNSGCAALNSGCAATQVSALPQQLRDISGYAKILYSGVE